jgi:hypothetical protein
MQRSNNGETISRNVLFVLSLVWTFTSAGFIFGFPAIADALISKGDYQYLCTENSVPSIAYNATSSTPSGTDIDKSCAAQRVEFGQIYVIGVSVFFVSFVLHGRNLDKYGPKITSLIGIIITIIGTFLLAFSSANHSKKKDNHFDFFLPALCLIGLGGPAPYLSSFHIVQLFGEKMSKEATSILVASMVGSALLYLCFARILLLGISTKVVFLSHAFWLIMITFLIAFLQPNLPFTTKDKIIFNVSYLPLYEVLNESNVADHQNKDIEISNSSDIVDDFSKVEYKAIYNDNEEEISSSSDIVNGAVSIDTKESDENNVSSSSLAVEEKSNENKQSIQELSIQQALISEKFILIAIFLTGHVLKFNFYLATALRRIENEKASRIYVTLLFIIVPLGCMITPIITWTVRRYGVAGVIWATQLFSLAFSALVMVHGHIALIISFLLLSIYRMFLFTCLYPYVSIVFGYKLFGRLNGILLTLSGIVSLLQYPLIILAESPMIFDGNYFFVDLIVFPVLTLLLTFLPARLIVHINNAET